MTTPWPEVNELLTNSAACGLIAVEQAERPPRGATPAPIAESQRILDAAESPRQLVTISCETAALTTLPDALLDDDAISPMAKMAYWYLKRHGGLVGNGDQICRELAAALRADYEYMWLTLAELRNSWWMTVSYDGTQVQFTVHEVPAVKR